MNSCLSDAALHAMLADDVPYGDLTTRSLGIGAQPAIMVMRARRAMRVCGSEEAARLVELAGGEVLSCVASGTQAAEGAELLRARGSLESLQIAWKTAQTLMEYLSGIASCAAEMLQLVRDEGFDLPLACTRKNFPGTRALAAKAVVAGGAVAHRLGLSETLLVFPDHRVFVDKAALPGVFARIRRQYPEKKLVAEAGDLAEALWLAECGAEILQLERFSPAALSECKQALATHNLRALLAPAGGVTRDNALAYARAGADFLVSSAPYFAPPRDVQVRFATPEH
ncbi:MAG: ModD protein [Proteobacteria bacterium]|nr:ModD protein [Pseudomonadota bacterium]